MTPKEIIETSIAIVHFDKHVAYKDIIQTLKNIIEELEQIQE